VLVLLSCMHAASFDSHELRLAPSLQCCLQATFISSCCSQQPTTQPSVHSALCTLRYSTAFAESVEYRLCTLHLSDPGVFCPQNSTLSSCCSQTLKAHCTPLTSPYSAAVRFCMQAPLPEWITLDGSELQKSAEHIWVTQNLGRIRHIILRADDAALSTDLAAATALHSLVVSECSTSQQLPVACGGLPLLTSLHFDRW
jgi:hypothetical protein